MRYFIGIDVAKFKHTTCDIDTDGIALFGYSSINLNSKRNKNSETTSKYWLTKILHGIE